VLDFPRIGLPLLLAVDDVGAEFAWAAMPALVVATVVICLHRQPPSGIGFASAAPTVAGSGSTTCRSRMGNRISRPGSLHDAGTHTQEELAEPFSVSRTTVYRQLQLRVTTAPL
jgi:hypothetical protein